MAKNLIACLLLALVAACTPPPPAEIDWHQFSGKRAYDHVQTLVNMGPRPAGSPTLTKAASYISSQLEEAGLETQEQVFVAPSPNGMIQFRNVIGKTPHSGSGKPVIVVASHYDTKNFTKMNFVGANDGGSSSGVLLELARCASRQTDIWFVFFDGEEAIQDYAIEGDGLVGSRYFVEDLKSANQVGSVQAMILLDMVGDAHLNVTIPANSTPGLVQQTFDASRDVGARDSFSMFKNGDMYDDHVPFLKAGIPAIDLIDFEFGSAPGLNDYWHTDKDTLDKIDPHSLEVVGQTALRLLAKIKAGGSVR